MRTWILLLAIIGIGPSVFAGGYKTHRMCDGTVLTFERNQAMRRVGTVPTKSWDADKVYRVPVVLLSFADCDFSWEDPWQFYDRLFNEPGYNLGKGPGCIADYFRDKEGKRPSVSVKNPDIVLNIHINDNQCTLSLDSSGNSLHIRGYRSETGKAPLNEVLAAGLIMMTEMAVLRENKNNFFNNYVKPFLKNPVQTFAITLVIIFIFSAVIIRCISPEKINPKIDKNKYDEIIRKNKELNDLIIFKDKEICRLKEEQKKSEEAKSILRSEIQSRDSHIDNLESIIHE